MALVNPSIENFKGIHTGEKIAILANGESLLEAPWDRLRGMKLLGTNKAWTEVLPDYHCSVHAADDLEGAIRLPILFTSEACPADAPASRIERVKALGTEPGSLGWSSDLSAGVYFRGVLYFALQVAAYMLGRGGKIFIFGLDWYGNHHHSDREMQPAMKRWQGEALRIAKGALASQGTEVFNCNLKSKCDIFERIRF